MNFNPYLVFDVPMSTDFETLRATYRRLARENHPDVAPDKLVATERMAQINRAWAILGDQEKRAAFDLHWRGQSEQARLEVWRREAAQREVARARSRRAAPAHSTKKSARPTKNGAQKGSPTKTKPKARSQAPLDAALYANESSPRALRLMRKITLASRVWHRDGNAKEAIEMCRAVLLSDGRNVPARELLSEIFAAQGRLEVAVMMLDQALQIAPDDLFLRRKRDHLERERFPASGPRPLKRPSWWQRMRARLTRRKR